MVAKDLWTGTNCQLRLLVKLTTLVVRVVYLVRCVCRSVCICVSGQDKQQLKKQIILELFNHDLIVMFKCQRSNSRRVYKAEIPRQQFPRSILVRHIRLVDFLVTCYRHHREDVTRMLRDNCSRAIYA